MVNSLSLCNLAKLTATKKKLKGNRLDYEFLKSSNFINIIHSKKCKILEINDTPGYQYSLTIIAIMLIMIKMKIIKTTTIYYMSLL